MNQWRRVRFPYATPSKFASLRTLVLVAERIGAGFLNRHMQVRVLPGTPHHCHTRRCRPVLRPRGRADRRWSSKPADAGSNPAEDAERNWRADYENAS